MERLTKRSTVYEEMVWFVDKENKDFNLEPCEMNSHHSRLAIQKLADYEDAEEQGLQVKIECHCKDCVHWSDTVAGATEHVKLCTVGGYMVGENGYCVYAEKKLAEMGGE